MNQISNAVGVNLEKVKRSMFVRVMIFKEELLEKFIVVA
jgi:hypothetical protein